MTTFKYRAKDKEGRLQSGKVEASNSTLAEQAITERDLEIILLSEIRPRFRIPLRGRVKARDIVIFSRQLSTLAGANVALVQSLRTLVVQTSNSELRKILVRVADDVEAGGRLSSALAKHPRVFDSFFVNMIKSGETAGRLSEVLNYLADQTEKEYDLVSKVRGAMLYPAFIVIGMIIISIILLIFVIPQLTEVLLESGAKLPLTTRILIAASSVTKKYWWLLFIGVVGIIVGFRAGLKNSKFKEKVDTLKLRIPVLGTLLQKIYLARVTRSLQILLSGGVDVVGALEVVAGVVGNAYYERLIRETRREVADGNSINTVLMQSSLVPPMVSQMLAVGEETGQLTTILEKLTHFYTREVDNGVTTLVSIIEPLLMVVIGIGVGMVVASIILPMYQLAGQF
ncbi:MAG: type II secretion system F family protein [bacterium]|nr:type II secretion system F family protein [bacterium]